MLPLEVAGLVNEFNIGPLTLTRFGVQTENNFGEYVEGATTAIEVDPIAAYSTPDNEAKLMPEGYRIAGLTTFVAQVELRTADSGAVPDTIAYRGRDWHLMKLVDHELGGAVWIAIGTAEERSA